MNRENTSQSTGRQFSEMLSNFVSRPVNVGDAERIISGSAGAALAVFAFTRKSNLAMLLGLAGGGMLLYRAISGHCDLYDMLGINTAREGGARPSDYFEKGIHVEVQCTINRSAQELFDFWWNFENLPRFMNHLESVRCESGGRSHWVAKGPAGTSVEWEAEVINMEPDRLIAWRSVGNNDVDNAGTVRFLPIAGGGGTELHVVLDYIPPAGKLGAAAAKLLGEDPRRQIEQDLARLKEMIESGKVAEMTNAQ